MQPSKNWTIKDFDVELRMEIRQAAEARDESVAAWMAGAARKALEAQKRDGIMPPGTLLAPPVLPINEAAALIAATFQGVQMAQAVGIKPPRETVRNALFAQRNAARAAVGKAPFIPKPRKPKPEPRPAVKLLESESV